MTEKLGDGKGPVGEQGETDREGCRVEEALLESSERDLPASKEKFSSNILGVEGFERSMRASGLGGVEVDDGDPRHSDQFAQR